MRKKNVFLVILLTLIFMFTNLAAQTTGKISGRVVDKKTGEPLIGCNIIVEGTTVGAAADENGDFYIINIRPGLYNVVANSIGYGSVKVENVRVNVNSTTFLNFELQPEAIQGEVVIVTASQMSIKKDQTSSIRNISADDIQRLPVENINQIVEMQPGVVGSHFRGGRSNENSYMIDGVMVTESFYHTGKVVDVTPDAVEDMEVITGTFNAEYGNAMSGVVNVVTKEGGEQLKGSFSINGGNYITSHNDIFVGMENTDLRIQDYTFNLSGPLLKKRMGFLLNGRYNKNRGYLNGIYRFKVDDYSNFNNYPDGNWVSAANGDNSYVDMDKDENVYLMGKLTARPLQGIKTSLVYTYNKSNSRNYDHAHFYNPFGVAKNHRHSSMVAFHLNHSLSKNAFYNLKLSYTQYEYGNYLYKDPLDPRYISDQYSSITGQWFSTGGQDKGHTIRSEDKYGLKFDLTWQMTHNHSIKTGIDLSQNNLDQKWRSIRNKYEGSDLDGVFVIDSLTGEIKFPYYEPEVRDDTTIYSDIYKKEPIQFAAYIQDKMEFENMVVNLGVRFDYFDPKTVYPTNWRNPANQDYFEDQSRISKYPYADPTYSFSPRLGLSYKLGEYALLRFSYGHFLQVPPLNYYYQNHTFRVTELGMMGNPLLKPQKTVSYETGLWLQLSQSMDFEVAVFYRDIYDLLSSRINYTYSQIRYGLYDNKDYGNVRGIEFKYSYTSGGFTLDANYSLQYTRGVADSPEYAFNRAGQDQDPVNKLIPLGWDQRHTFNLIAGYNTKKYGASLLCTYSSGMPYSWRPITESPLALINLLPNNERRPSKFNVDLQAHYNVMTVGKVKVKFTALVYNLLDRLNEQWVNSTTGRAYTAIIRPIDIETYRSNFSEYKDIIQNPSAYSAPRSVKLGLSFQF
ncbi:MAG: TonB-dependent receptor [Candidatus Marinimicrobia bacterium]|nr:TonB-dependent receptor [Candidatus Neomarinimicrobiota bacterium]